jgi:hypothetical protein
MKKLFVLFFAISFYTIVAGQDVVVSKLRSETSRNIAKAADTAKFKWKKGGLLSANLSQGTLSNWAAGGDNYSMALGIYTNAFIYYLDGRNSWDNNIDFNFGYIQTTSLGTRKTDDRFDYLSKYGYKLDTTAKMYLSALFNFRTQFFDGYTYSGSVPDYSSSLLSPAYFILSAGLDYKPSQKFSAFVSPVTVRWIYVMNDAISAKGLYGVDSFQHSATEFGAYTTFNYNNTIAKNVTYKGRLDLFSNYLNHPENIDLYMTNMFSFRINKLLAATYSLDLIYDDDVRLFGPNQTSPGLQLKSVIGIGFLMPLKTVRKI